jgi:hypothetical protein
MVNNSYIEFPQIQWFGIVTNAPTIEKVVVQLPILEYNVLHAPLDLKSHHIIPKLIVLDSMKEVAKGE